MGDRPRWQFPAPRLGRGRVARRWAGWLLVLCGTIVATIMLGDTALIFFPTRHPTGFWDLAALEHDGGVSIEDCFFSVGEGPRIHGWWCRPAGRAEQGSLPLILFFHGNAGNLSDRAAIVIRLASLPAEVLIVDYRGYGKSEGRPSEHGVFEDARAAWTFATRDHRVEEERVVVFGRSLGAAVAIDLATDVQPAGLIIESAFTSIADMARAHYPFVPRFLIRTRMDSRSKVPSLTCPKLFVHSTADEIVPFEQGTSLYRAAAPPKQFHEIRGARHNETWEVGGDSYFDAIRRFVAANSVPAAPNQSS